MSADDELEEVDFEAETGHMAPAWAKRIYGYLPGVRSPKDP